MEGVSKYYDIVVNKVVDWSENFVSMLPNFILALLAFFLFVVIGKYARKLLRKILNKTLNNPSLSNLLARIFYVIIILIGTFVALSVLNLEKTVTSLLAGAGIIGLALGFAFQDIAANFISGFLMAARRPFHVGDVIETSGYSGVVKEINIRTTSITSFQGQHIIIPNKEVFQTPLINDSVNGKKRIDLAVGVSYGDDLQKVKKVTLEAVQNVSHRTEDDIELIYTDFGDSSINLKVRIWVKFETQGQYKHCQSEAIMAIKEAYDNNDIMIPFPIRTLDFGIKGGEKLNTMLSERANP
ncbi:MAG: mechanosensitive ion channel [Brumimicrobium sp.]|nr:mechanosensitive ion channel [Brumimicrobium sp.]